MTKRIRRAVRDQRALPWLENLRRDVGYALRGMRRNRGFTAVAVACLALGIGANTAIFSVANAVMVRSLPVRDPAQVVLFRYESPGDIAAVQRTRVGDDQTAFPYAVYEALRERAHTLSGVIAWVPLGLNEQSLTVHAAGQSTVTGGEMVSGNYFGVLGVSPALGRAIIESDLEPGAPNVAVVSHRFWLRELGGDRAAIGTGITLNRLPFTIVGVTAPEFLGVNPAMPPDVWISLRDLPGLKPWGRLRSGPGGLSPFADRRYWWCLMMGRLKPGVTERQVSTDVDALFREAITEGLEKPPSAERLPHIVLAPARRGLDDLRRSLFEPLGILMAAVGLVLLIALLFGAGLFVRTLQNLEHQDLGFNRRNLLLFEIDPRRGGATIDQTVAIYDRVIERLRTLPGVRSASVSATAMLSGYTDAGPVSTDAPLEPSEETSDVYFNIVGPGLAETMGIQVLAGREIDTRDVRERNRVAVVNAALARRLFPNRDPVGHRLSQEVPFDPRNAYEIVGVVKDVRHGGIRSAPPPTAYLPYGALPERVARMCVAVRTAGDPLLHVPAVHATMRSIDPTLPVIDIRTESDEIDRVLKQERMFAGLSSLFGLLGLLLVSVGVYGTLAYGVTRRTAEIGVRMALGASRWRVRWMVLRESLLLAGSGLAIGLPAALALSRLMASRLFGVTPHDGWSIAATAAVLATSAILAGLVPANQASRIDPLRALRCD